MRECPATSSRTTSPLGSTSPRSSRNERIVRRLPAALLALTVLTLPSLPAGAGEVIDAAAFAERCASPVVVAEELTVSGGTAVLPTGCSVAVEPNASLRLDAVTLDGDCCGFAV